METCIQMKKVRFWQWNLRFYDENYTYKFSYSSSSVYKNMLCCGVIIYKRVRKVMQIGSQDTHRNSNFGTETILNCWKIICDYSRQWFNSIFTTPILVIPYASFRLLYKRQLNILTLQPTGHHTHNNRRQTKCRKRPTNNARQHM